MKLYGGYLTFDNCTDPQVRDYFNSLPTSFKLSKQQVDKLIYVCGNLLEENHDFKKFIAKNKKN
jgi:hypothetical protein